jgi:aspartyl-tRNA(Asn)/glutamyl-tRNA(Gln) amidotransferase subunit A
MNLVGKSASELRNLVKSREVSATEILNEHFAYIEAKDNSIQSFNCLTKELALEQAKRVDRIANSKEPLPALAGVPAAIKDNMCVRGYPTTCSSRILKNFTPSFESTAVQQLFEAGALCLGKTNLDEFAMGSSTENSAIMVTRNPWNSEYVPGGSSGGSAAAVAAGFAPIALGSDTGGSVRQPASFCGIVGMKPTYGLISRFGLVAFASSLDQIGPFARGVEDTALTLAAIAKHDPRDSTSLPDTMRREGEDLTLLASNLANLCDITNWKIGIIKELSGEGNEKEVVDALSRATEVFTSLGATVDDVSVPRAKSALAVYYILATAEASANLARYDGVKYGYRHANSPNVIDMYNSSRSEGFGSEVKRRIMLGTYVLSSGYYDAYYKKAQQVRKLLCGDFAEIFRKYDLVICPTSPTVAFRFGDKTDDPLKMYLSDIASIPVNLAGLPGISIPCGFGKGHMPIGLQLIGAPLSDARILKAAYAFEKATDFHLKHPAMLAQTIAV